MVVCWISAGVSSFVAGWLARDHVDKFIYIDIADQHPDSMRFIQDCEKALDKPIEVLRNNQYHSVSDVCRAMRFVRSAYFAPCTNVLKKRVRKQWEHEHADYSLTYVWGMDLNEKRRADRLTESMTEFSHEFPLIERGLSKQDAHGILKRLGIKRPAMYDMGYQNNNCVGCLRGGRGYWNKIRVDFPEVFADRAKMEREIGHSIIRDCFLDELPPDSGRMQSEIMEECGIYCSMAYQDTERLAKEGD